MADASCLCCGHVGTPAASLIDRPEVYVCKRCHRRATLPAPERLATEEEGDAYMHGWFDGNEADPYGLPRWRNKKRGTYYSELGLASVQAEGAVHEGQRLVIYRGDDGELWARPVAEFHDGRFERIADGVAIPRTVREFTNELGNRIRITIEGPTSTSENVLTPMEAAELREALNAHGVKGGWCTHCGCGNDAAGYAHAPLCQRPPKGASDAR